MTTKQWVRHTWDLTTEVARRPAPEGYELAKGGCNDFADMFGVIASAFRSDPAWDADLGEIIERLNRRMCSTLGRDGIDYLLATSGEQLVAVSGLAKSHPGGRNFLTGVCIHPRYQRRGLGTFMLGESLARLRAMGAASARVYTKEGTVADRYLYPHFHSKRDRDVTYAGASELPHPARWMSGWIRFPS